MQSTGEFAGHNNTATLTRIDTKSPPVVKFPHDEVRNPPADLRILAAIHAQYAAKPSQSSR